MDLIRPNVWPNAAKAWGELRDENPLYTACRVVESLNPNALTASSNRRSL